MPGSRIRARLFADLPLPVAAACCDAVDSYAQIQHHDGDDRPIGQIRCEILTDLILRPWQTNRPPVTAEITIHLTIPTAGSGGGTGTAGSGSAATGAATTGCRLDEDAVEAEVNGQSITAAQCQELLTLR